MAIHMQGSDTSYLLRRADEERRAAELATDLRAKRSHSELAARYRRLAEKAQQQLGRSTASEIRGAAASLLPTELHVLP
jgi:hypothetical protein